MKGVTVKNLIKLRYNFQATIFAAIVISFAGFYMCATFAQAWLLFLSLAIAMVLSIWAHLRFMNRASKEKTITQPSDKVTVFVLVLSYALLCISLTRYSINAFLSDGFGLFFVTLAFTAIVFAALTLFEILFISRFVQLKKFSEIWAKNKLTIIFLSILSVVLIVLNLEIFSAWFRWDSYEYYAYAQRQTLKSLTDLEYMRLANHAAYSCALLYMLFNGIVGNYITAVYLVNLLMLVCGSWMFFGIARQFSKTQIFPMTAACVYAFSPFTFGFVYSISLETFLAFGILLFFYGEAKKLPILQILASLLICFSKETGAVILVAIMALKLVFYWISNERKNLPFTQRINLSFVAPIFACGLLWLWDYFAFSWISSNENTAMQTTDGKAFNNFAISFTYIKDRMLSFLFTNFTWIIVILVAVGFVIGIIRRKKLFADTEEKQFVWLVIAGFSTSLIPMFLFVTYNHVRYATPTLMLLLLLLPFALKAIFKSTRVRSWICSVLAALSLGQCYFTIDPTMYLFFDTIDKGNGKIIYTSNNIISDDMKRTQAICVPAQYNREIMYFDFALNTLMQEIGYDENTCIMLSSEYMEPYIGGYVGTEYLIWGFGYPYTDYPKYVSFSQDRQKLYLANDRSEMVPATSIYASTSAMYISIIYDRAIYIQLPFRDEAVEQELLGIYNREEIAKVNVNGWELVAYEITEK